MATPGLVPIVEVLPPAPVVQASSDQQLIALWLRRRSPNTARSYRRAADRLFAFTGRPLASIRLSDLQDFADSLTGMKESSQATMLAAIKSLFSFAVKLGYLRFDVGKMLELPKPKDTLAERILPEPDVQRILAFEQQPRNHCMLRVLYGSGIRVSELCGLAMRDAQPREDAGQLCLYGKGRKTRCVLLSAETWKELQAFWKPDQPDAPLFRSQKGGHLVQSQVCRIVRKAARRAGIALNVSPHWFRHANASHAIQRGCPLPVVQQTLGHSSVATTGKYLHARPGESTSRYLAV